MQYFSILFWYKIFVHWKLILLNFLVVSILNTLQKCFFVYTTVDGFLVCIHFGWWFKYFAFRYQTLGHNGWGCKTLHVPFSTEPLCCWLQVLWRTTSCAESNRNRCHGTFLTESCCIWGSCLQCKRYITVQPFPLFWT